MRDAPSEAAVEWRMTLPDGTVCGPTVTLIFAQWIAAGRVPADARVWRTGWETARIASEVADQLPAPLPGQAESPAGPTAPDLPPGLALPPEAKAPEEPGREGDAIVAPVVGSRYASRRKRAARRRRYFVIGLLLACFALAVMLVVLLWIGPTASVPNAAG